jgi:hypothetical protein
VPGGDRVGLWSMGLVGLSGAAPAEWRSSRLGHGGADGHSTSRDCACLRIMGLAGMRCPGPVMQACGSGGIFHASHSNKGEVES